MKALYSTMALVLGGMLSTQAQTTLLDTTIALQDVEIAGERIQTRFSQSARSMDILQRSDIEQLPVQNVAEILSYVPGVDNRQRGPQGVQADVGIRGGSFDQTLVLLNGIKLSDPQTGHHLLNLVVHPDQIERIEVLKGPGTRIYGPNAFAGAINIITKPGAQKGLSGSLSGGQHGLYQGNIALHLPVGKWQQTLSAGLNGASGYRFNADFSMANVFYDAQRQLGIHKIYTMAGYNQRAFGANGFYANENFKDQFEKTKTIFAAAGWKMGEGNWKSDLRSYYRQHEDDYFFNRQRPSDFHNHHISRVGGVEWNGSIDNAFGTSAFGAEWRYESIVSSNLGIHQRQIGGFYGEHRLSGKKWQLTPGIYLNGISDYGWRAYPGVDMAFFPAKGLNLYANLAQSFRVPTYTDLYYQSPANLGNPNLLPEQAWTYEIGSRYFYKAFLLSGAVFVRDASRLIEWVRPDALSPWQANNFIEVVSRGAEAELQFKRSKGLLRSARIGYTYINAGFAVQSGLQSRYILENLRHQMVLAAVLQLPAKIQASATLRIFERMNQNEAFAISDVQLSRKLWKQGELFVQATNVFNTPYREIGTVPMPGRWMRLGLRFRL